MLNFAPLATAFVAAAVMIPALVTAPTALVLTVVAAASLLVLFVVVSAFEEGDG